MSEQSTKPAVGMVFKEFDLGVWPMQTVSETGDGWYTVVGSTHRRDIARWDRELTAGRIKILSVPSTEAKAELNASTECQSGLFSTMNGPPRPDNTVTSAVVSHSGAFDDCIGFVVDWETKSTGFGQLTVSVYKDGSVKLDTECMSKRFAKDVLAKLVDSAEVK